MPAVTGRVLFALADRMVEPHVGLNDVLLHALRLAGSGLGALPVAATNRYRDAYSLRDHAASFMTPAQIAEAQKLAREWKPK